MAPKADAKADPKPKMARPKKPALNKEKALVQVQIDADDDERTAISKKISWILRKGADRIGIASYTINKQSWYKLTDIMAAEIMDDVTEPSPEKFMELIKESNTQKLRYEIKEGSDGILLRALQKEERKRKDEGDDKAPASEKESSSKISVEKTNVLKADAPAFVPSGDPNKAATAAAMTYASAMSYPYGYPMGYPGYPWPYGYGGMMGGAQPTAAVSSDEKRFTGVIKSFNPEKGFGFIESPEAYAFFQRDVFLHKALIGNLTVGANVTFLVEKNEKGMPQARDIKGIGGTGGKGKGKGKGKKGEKGKEKGDEEAKGEGKGKKKKEKKEKKGGESKEGETETKEKEPGEEKSEATAPASTEATSS